MKAIGSISAAVVPVLVGTLATSSARAGEAAQAVHLVEAPLPAGSVREIGGFVGGRFLANENGYLKPFDIDRYTRLFEVKAHRDWLWPGEQAGKWLESAAWTSRTSGDGTLEGRARQVLARLVAAQEPSGYLGITDPAIRTDERPLRGMDPYEHYYLMHGLMTAAEVWGDADALRAASRLGDYFVAHIGPGKAEFWPGPLCAPENRGQRIRGHSAMAGHSGHYSLEGTLLIDPMLRLYQKTGEARYLDWSLWVVGSIDRWGGWDAFSNLDKVADGTMGIHEIQPYVHVHTLHMNLLGLLRLYRITDDATLLRKVKGAWDDVARRQMYITGGVSVDEHYEKGFHRPINDDALETCATMSWLLLSQALLEVTGEPRYADVVERLLFNQVFASQTVDGDCFRNKTPPNGSKPDRYFHNPDCCTSSGHRMISSLPRVFYAQGPDGLFVNQFVPSTAAFELADGTAVTVEQEGRYPESDTVTVRVRPAQPARFALHVRIPGWCKRPSVMVNGEALAEVVPGSYARIDRTWTAGDAVRLSLPMSFHWVEHDHYGEVEPAAVSAPWALVRGPVVFALDTVWWDDPDVPEPRSVAEEVGIDRTAGDPPRLRPAAPDALGPFCEVTVKLADGPFVQAPMVPFANVGRWYRDGEPKPERNSRAFSYAVWLQDGDGPGFARLVEERRRPR